MTNVANSVSIWRREDVADQEWLDLIDELKQDIKRIEEDRQRILDEDGYAFYHQGMMNDKSKAITLASNKGIGWEYGLTDLDGNLLNAKMVDTKYGSSWVINEDDGSVIWVNVSVAQDVERRKKFYQDKGVALVRVYYHYALGKFGFYADKSRGVVSVEKDGE